ncbi:ABC transporter ATP-binding protein [Micromonospora sp. NBRC 101691]|uniref:ABC transporter ATP-binding protein n=1 Tax=Micromonospora sp. NBRC 101691 TaxID=3032198 RepID=UPI0024A3AFBC|nr:ABC transporter ATP-binding protein [Micromonospora sp. NBRC 101691]GLY22197.1 ABC transporter ATP-binding protein [Micromonospora sp. NBRC 101691]
MVAPPPTRQPLLSVDDLVVSFDGPLGTHPVLNGVSFHVDAGETLAILGESGSGKSVTVRAVMALLPRHSATIARGTIRYDGEELTALPVRRTRQLCSTEFAMVFQDSLSALNPVVRVGDQIAELYRVRRGVSRREAWARAVAGLEQVGIPHAAQRARDYPHQFSGGMRQRVVIAMALALGPRLLIADEPTTALDVTVQAQIMDLLRDLRRANGMAMILITHDLGVVADVADRVAVMYAGSVVETGPLRTVYDTPAHPYTRGLMNSIPTPEHAGARLTPIEGMPPAPHRMPTGCAFHPRCPLARPRCRTDRPALREITPGQLSACHYAEEVVTGVHTRDAA